MTQIPSKRVEAEKTLLQFKQIPNNLAACKYILGTYIATNFTENTSSSMVQFHMASAISYAIIREYSSISQKEVHSTREFLIEYVSKITYAISFNIVCRTERYAHEQLLQSAAICTKRAWPDAPLQIKQHILIHITELLKGTESEVF